MIVKKLLPIKAHFFFFMAALGPVLPQLQVVGKELGISSVVMGTVTGILPFVYLLAKPAFGVIVDIYRDYRKTIFMGLIAIMAVSYGCLIFIPLRTPIVYKIQIGEYVNRCDIIDNSPNSTLMECSSKCSNNKFQVHFIENSTVCATNSQIIMLESSCEFQCKESAVIPDEKLMNSVSFWCFVMIVSVGTISFNVVNSISDAVCFDMIGDEYDYGKQRTWGSVGYGATALLSGFAMDNLFNYIGGYKPAIIIMLLFVILDLISCLKLKLPIIPAPQNIWKELTTLMKYKEVCVFLIFTIIAGTVDGFLTYFLLWYVEDIATLSSTQNIKMLEGFIIAAETFGGEILFFYIGDNILEKLGHMQCFSVCFLCYALRLALISVVASPWIIIVIEFLLQGPTYALTYLTIVAYANDIAPSGTSATMQGIAAGLDDGLGYALGSLLGGILYSYTGPRQTFQLFAIISCISGIAHYFIHKYYFSETDFTVTQEEVKYDSVLQSSTI